MEISLEQIREAIREGYAVSVIVNGEEYTLTGGDSRTAAARQNCTNKLH